LNLTTENTKLGLNFLGLYLIVTATFFDLFLYYNIAMTDSSDRSLVTRTLQGDTHAFGALVRCYQNSVFNVCYRLLGNRHEAEDLAQDAFIRAYQRLRSFDPERPFGPWMRRVAANLCYNHLQKNQLPQTYLNDEIEMPKDAIGVNPEQTIEIREQSASIRAALLALPPHYRVTLELRHFQELSYEEMAAELDLPLNTVKSHLFRARKQLAKLLLPEKNRYA
jgi:RNA polymerase sigma-70 factor (ECF subfamily)